MSMIIALGMMALSPPAADAAHHHATTIEHRGVPMNVSYRASVDLATKPMGVSPPTRGGTDRCAWVATIAVERQMAPAGGAGLTRIVSSDYKIKGSRAGSCMTSRKAIEQEVAARDAEIRSHVMAVADRDKSTLMAELEAAARVSVGAS
ncbi:hypothetical protein [Rhizorhabdus sp. FW153]|uniref:hypothetical protein n=1 Tax=Rhizorhabdus sp. FW153 TaxID=3400216 RepID=UPI003CF2FBA3